MLVSFSWKTFFIEKIFLLDWYYLKFVDLFQWRTHFSRKLFLSYIWRSCFKSEQSISDRGSELNCISPFYFFIFNANIFFHYRFRIFTCTCLLILSFRNKENEPNFCQQTGMRSMFCLWTGDTQGTRMEKLWSVNWWFCTVLVAYNVFHFDVQEVYQLESHGQTCFSYAREVRRTMVFKVDQMIWVWYGLGTNILLCYCCRLCVVRAMPVSMKLVVLWLH